jgi:hypothetical protein
LDEEGLRLSLAGAQERTSFLRRNGKWHRPLRSTPTTHIFKLPLGQAAGRSGLGEWSLEVAPASIVQFGWLSSAMDRLNQREAHLFVN